MNNVVTLVLVVGFLVTTGWVCVDAWLHRITTDGHENYHLGNGAAAWARDCVLLWVAAFPWYLIRRGQVLRARAHSGPSPAAPPPAPVFPNAGAARPSPVGTVSSGLVAQKSVEKRRVGRVYECEDCETQLSAGARFCPGCGQKFDVPVPDDAKSPG